MPPADDALAAEWLAAADEDLAVVERALAGDAPLVRSALFHAEQCAEKALKSVLAVAGLSIPRTYDLEFLLDMVRGKRPELEELREDLRTLSAYAVQPRYPGDATEYTVEEARAAADRARRVLDAAKAS